MSYVDTLSPATNSEIPTVTDNLFSQGTISAHEISVSFEPLTEDNELNGELTWGAYNVIFKSSARMLKYLQVEPTPPNSLARSPSRTLFSTCLWPLFKLKLCSPITDTSPASEFWGINESIEYGTTTILSTTAGIVDTGASAVKQRKYHKELY